MRPLLALWEKEWLALSRDVHGLAVLFLMPAAFIVVMSLALSDVFEGAAGRATAFGVVSADAKLADAFARGLAGNGFRPAPAPADEAAARASVRLGNHRLVLLIPRDFDKALAVPPGGTGGPPGLVLLAEPALPPTQLVAFQQRVLGVVLGLRMSEAIRAAGIPVDARAFDLGQAAKLDVQVIGGSGRPSSVQQNVPAWLIFGMFLVVMPISALFILERRDGTLARLASLQVPFSLLLLGKIGPYFLINLAQALLMFAAGKTLVPWFGGESLALPARWDLLAIVTACTSLAAIGWGLLVAVSARTMEQATVLGGIGTILVAAIGGIMVPRFVMPESMQTLVNLSPMSWALEGFHAVMLRQGSAADIVSPCLKLLALALALLAAALWIYHRRRIIGAAA
jgi:ABC-2 type transport system permease protein